MFSFGETMIKIDFEFETSWGMFRDALHLPEDHTFSESDIADMKRERLNNWLAIVNAPPQENPEPPPSNQMIIDGYEYLPLEGVPPSGAKVTEVNGVWYYRV